MDLKQKLIDLSRKPTGDDSITVAGDFHPRDDLEGCRQ
jgi:hypothetical protein